MLPLENIKVLDLSRLAAGNMVSHMFADFGADVIKIEKPGQGDDLRNWQIIDISHWWAVYSRNKRSLALNLKDNEGLNLLKELVKSADVFIENFIPALRVTSFESASLAEVCVNDRRPALIESQKNKTPTNSCANLRFPKYTNRPDCRCKRR